MKQHFLSLDDLNAVPGNAYQSFPLVVNGENASTANSLSYFAGLDLDELLIRYGAVLFRGFQIHDEVDEVLSKLDPGFSNSATGSQSNRDKVTRRTATSTGAPSFFYIPQHIEWNYNGRFPNKLAFFCVDPPEHDGSTVIADNRNLTKQLPERALKKLYTEYNYTFAFSSQYTAKDLSAYFDVPREEDAYEKMRDLGFELLEKEKGSVLKSTRSCLMRHPVTEELLVAMPLEFLSGRVFANGAASMKYNKKKRGKYQMMSLAAHALEKFGKRFTASRITFSEGKVWTRSDYRDYLKMLNANKVYFKWQKGDLLILDNYLVTHGKQPHAGKRQILVSMGELLDRDSLAVLS